MAAGLEPKLD